MRRAASVCLWIMVLVVWGATPAATAREPDDGVYVVDRSASRRVAELIGSGTINDTGRRFGVEGADLGHMVAHRGRLAMVFGDTYGAPPADPFFAVPHEDWRSNVLAWIDPPVSPAGGLRFDDMVTDRPGHAAELLGSRKVPGDEQTVIPTYGISVGSRLYLHYMSVREFTVPGRWTLNSSGIAYSDDDGATWTKDPATTWPAGSGFGQVSFSRVGDDVYLHGVPGGRYGGVSLARVPADDLLDPQAYRYWTGSGWSADQAAATEVLPGPVGELSVGFNSFHRKWIMMYLVDPTGEIVLRTADDVTGPWSDPQVVLDTRAFPDAYAPYLTPMWNDGPDVWFTMSQFGPYRVSLMRTRLDREPAGTPLPPEVRPTPPDAVVPGPREQLPYEHGRGL